MIEIVEKFVVRNEDGGILGFIEFDRSKGKYYFRSITEDKLFFIDLIVIEDKITELNNSLLPS